jgi:putative hydrolase of the HAD superfamily
MPDRGAPECVPTLSQLRIGHYARLGLIGALPPESGPVRRHGETLIPRPNLSDQTGDMRGVLLDVGGVFLVPTRDRISEALAELTGALAHEACDRAHFDGIHAIDLSDVPGDGDRQIYLAAYLSSLGVSEELLEPAIDRLIPLWSGSSLDLWQRVLDESITGLRTLHEAKVRLGIVSNSDGHVEEELIRSKICQLGPGLGVPVQTIIDSGVVGVAKPDPVIFDLALVPLELEPSDVIYVGDSVKYDVRSAQAAGMMPLHFDPFGLCADTDHLHVDRVSDVLRFV